MSAIPAFEIGVWNAWILTVYQVLAIPFLFYIAGKRGATHDEELDLPTMRRVISSFTKVFTFLILIYSI